MCNMVVTKELEEMELIEEEEAIDDDELLPWMKRFNCLTCEAVNYKWKIGRAHV